MIGVEVQRIDSPIVSGSLWGSTSEMVGAERMTFLLLQFECNKK